jgi:hypothetical protein
MKFISKHISVFLAVVFLLSSLGFTANRMICLKSGKQKISLIPINDCCKKTTLGKHSVKSKCCDINNNEFQLSDFRSVEKTETIPIKLHLFELPFFLVQHSNVSTEYVYIFFPPPPLLFGKIYIHFISTLLI